MEIVKITAKNQWEDKAMSFPQSWAWGDILISEGSQVERLAVKDGDNIVALAQVIYNRLPLGRQYAFCPKGPTIISNFQFPISNVYDAVGEYFLQKNCVFLRIEPSAQFPTSDIRCLKSQDINPRATVILNLQKSESDILAGMHPKTRYNIRLAEKKNLRVSADKNFKVFFKLMKATGRRDKFHLHSDEHYQAVLAAESVRQVTVYFEETPVAVGVFIYHGDTATYLYGASNYQYRHLMAPYLVQWEGIKLAKSLGSAKYDWFGVAPWKKNEGGEQTYDEKHQYAGVTRFKMGFGGEYAECPGTFDVVLDEREYLAYRILRRLRRLF
ncbi:MAG: peptidoglycan bridge formation glycyltransferase FemA/FemB family protein [bacterium]|nr:peptidoglycan bridge formation glycyltransferase FemA/FemB family protein [bacterium]